MGRTAFWPIPTTWRVWPKGYSDSSPTGTWRDEWGKAAANASPPSVRRASSRSSTRSTKASSEGSHERCPRAGMIALLFGALSLLLLSVGIFGGGVPVFRDLLVLVVP